MHVSSSTVFYNFHIVGSFLLSDKKQADLPVVVKGEKEALSFINPAAKPAAKETDKGRYMLQSQSM